MIDASEAEGIGSKGLALKDDDGNVVLYATSGDGSPVGTEAPVNTWYFRRDTKTLYVKDGDGDSDWTTYDGSLKIDDVDDCLYISCDIVKLVAGRKINAGIRLDGIMRIL